MMRFFKRFQDLGIEGAKAKYYDTLTREHRIGEMKEQAKEAAEYIKDGATVLEVAPGAGYLSIELARLGKYKITGMDISKDLVEICTENAKEAGVKIDFRQGNASDMPFNAGTFDIIICVLAFKNFKEPLRALREMHRVLKPGGTTLIMDLDRQATIKAMKKIAENMGLKGLKAYVAGAIQRSAAYSRKELETFISQTEFKDQEIRNTEMGFFISLKKADFPSTADEAALKVVNDPVVTTKGPMVSPEPPELVNFSGSNLVQSDFAGVTAHHRRFNGSALRGANFSGADLTGSTFTGSDIREAIFDGTNLTDCILSASVLSDARFNKTIFVRTEINASAFGGAKFIDAVFTDVKMSKFSLRKSSFENCSFNGVEFKYVDLQGLCFDGLTFTGVKFHHSALNEVTFKEATLRNVSFRAPYAITNKYYKALKAINFDGAKMDKLTYAALKGVGADLSKVSFMS